MQKEKLYFTPSRVGGERFKTAKQIRALPLSDRIECAMHLEKRAEYKPKLYAYRTFAQVLGDIEDAKKYYKREAKERLVNKRLSGKTSLSEKGKKFFACFLENEPEGRSSKKITVDGLGANPEEIFDPIFEELEFVEIRVAQMDYKFPCKRKNQNAGRT